MNSFKYFIFGATFVSTIATNGFCKEQTHKFWGFEELENTHRERLNVFLNDIGDEIGDLIPVENFGTIQLDEQNDEDLSDRVFKFLVTCYRLINLIEQSEFRQERAVQQHYNTINQQIISYEDYLFTEYYDNDENEFNSHFPNDLMTEAIKQGSSNAVAKLWQKFVPATALYSIKQWNAVNYLSSSIECNSTRCIQFFINFLQLNGDNAEQLINELSGKIILDWLFTTLDIYPDNIISIRSLMQNGFHAYEILDQNSPNYANYEPLRNMYNQILTEINQQ